MAGREKESTSGRRALSPRNGGGDRQTVSWKVRNRNGAWCMVPNEKGSRRNVSNTSEDVPVSGKFTARMSRRNDEKRIEQWGARKTL